MMVEDLGQYQVSAMVSGKGDPVALKADIAKSIPYLVCNLCGTGSKPTTTPKIIPAFDPAAHMDCIQHAMHALKKAKGVTMVLPTGVKP
jgi:hypothetical protein